MTSQQKFFLFAEQNDFHERSGLAQWRVDEQALMLEQNQQPRLSTPNWEEAQSAWESARPMVVDAFGGLGEIIQNAKVLGFRTHWQDEPNRIEDQHSQPIELEEGEFTDLHFGGKSRLALGISDIENSHFRLGVFHLRQRWWQTIALAQAPVRVWTDADDQTWVLCENTLFLCGGQPLPNGYTPKTERFEPANINPGSLRVIDKIPLPEQLTKPLALCEDGMYLFLLGEHVVDDTRQQKIFIFPLPNKAGQNKSAHKKVGTHGQWETLDLPDALSYASDIHPLEKGRIALMLPAAASDPEYKNRDCPILKLSRDTKGRPRLTLVKQRYPMLFQERARFATSEDRKLRYFAEDGPRQLFPLAQARFIPQASFNLLKVLDSGMPDTQWHKVVFEACIPRSCQVSLSVFCSDEEDADDNHEKEFLLQHKPLWRPLDSELPFHPGWGTAKPAERGLYEVLLQRPQGEVRELRGRYLQLRLSLSGDGRSSPAIHAIRVYYPRLCWQQNFLPQHFHQQKAVDIDNKDAANGADIRQRIFASLECMLTPLEDRIGASECLFDPHTAPEPMLANIADAVGINPLPALWPEARKRRLISEAGALQQRHGTYAGLVLALDIATDGAVAAGQIVPLENFRFRRTLATILGVSLDDKQHPLTLGSGDSGNSIVGDSLILTKKGAREFLALLTPQSYSVEPSENQNDEQLMEDFFRKYAHRMSVLLHGDAKRWQHNVDAVLRQYAPAHLQWNIKKTDHPFVLGLAPLLQIDTYLQHRPAAKRVVLNQTLLGREGLIENASSLSFESRPSPADTLSGTTL